MKKEEIEKVLEYLKNEFGIGFSIPIPDEKAIKGSVSDVMKYIDYPFGFLADLFGVQSCAFNHHATFVYTDKRRCRAFTRSGKRCLNICNDPNLNERQEIIAFQKGYLSVCRIHKKEFRIHPFIYPNRSGYTEHITPEIRKERERRRNVEIARENKKQSDNSLFAEVAA